MERECITFIRPDSRYLLVQYADEHDSAGLEKEYQTICEGTDIPFSLVALKVNDWNRELSPWKAPPVFGNQPFGGDADETLRELTEELLPRIKAEYGLRDDVRIILGGYSLAGLFALWSGFNSDAFDGIAAASPSVWFPGWTDYAAKTCFRAQRVYLSLGDREEKTRNRVMATVGDCIRRTEQIFAEKAVPCVLEWNEGNHFRDADIRTAKAFLGVIC